MKLRNLLVISDHQQKMAKQIELEAVPSAFILNTEGHILYKKMGFGKKSINLIQEKINQLLSEKTDETL